MAWPNGSEGYEWVSVPHLTKGNGWLCFGVAWQRVESLFFVGLEQGTFLDGDVALSVHVGIKVRKSESPVVG